MSKVVTLSEAKGLIRITPVTRVRCFALLSMTSTLWRLTEALRYERASEAVSRSRASPSSSGLISGRSVTSVR